MQPDWSVRVLTMDDYDAVHRLWTGLPGLGLSAADSRAGIRQFLERNPGLSRVATIGARIVGTALCGHDGRRGYLYHLAVEEDVRGRGIGRALLSGCLDQLARQHIDKCHAFVYRENEIGSAFWRRVGADERVELVIFSTLPSQSSA